MPFPLRTPPPVDDVVKELVEEDSETESFETALSAAGLPFADWFVSRLRCCAFPDDLLEVLLEMLRPFGPFSDRCCRTSFERLAPMDELPADLAAG